MAGYKPKSLDELNNIFDKTMAAEKAIKKSSSLLEREEAPEIPKEPEITEDTPDLQQEATPQEITDSVNDFIARLSSEAQAQPVKAKPQLTFISPEPIKREPEAKKDVFSLQEDLPTETEKPSRDDLFSEYARIMSDEDDDIPTEKRRSRKEKKRNKKKDKQKEKSPSEPSENPQDEEPYEASETQQSEPSPDQAPESTSFILAEDNTNNKPEEEPSGENELVSNDNDFDFPEDYTPDWLKQEQEEAPVVEEKEKDGKHTIIKTLLSIVLVILIAVGALATIFKVGVAVNTGKLVADKYYVFTAYDNYPDSSIPEGALIITEKKFAEDGDIFAYADHNTKAFQFGKRTDSITKEDGEVLYIMEKGSGRTLVSRDDTKGVVYRCYEGRGRLVSLLTDYYIVIMAIALVFSLVIILLFLLAFKDKRKLDEEYDEELYEDLLTEGEEDFEDIFSTIE